MFDIGSVLSCAQWNLCSMRKNPRVILGFSLGFGLCFFLTQRTLELADLFSTDLQILEPFVWCFADADSVLFASLALLLPLSQIPRLDAPAHCLMFRRGRVNWLWGQVLTAAALSLAYVLFLLASAVLFAGGRGFWENRWSGTAAVMSFAPEQLEAALSVGRKTVKLTSPLFCAAAVFFLMAQYMLYLTLLNLSVSLWFGKRAGMTAVAAVSLCSFLLQPEKLRLWLKIPQEAAYIANTFAAWLSPLNHAAYSMHSFDYGNYPSLLQTHLVFGGLHLVLLFCAYGIVKYTEFAFTGGDHG